MSWNEPGGKKKDPWGGNNNNDAPPDLDEVFRKLQAKLRAMLGGGGRGNRGFGRNGDDGNAGGAGKSFGVSGAIVAVVVVVFYAISGFYIVKPAEQAVVTRFGKYNRTVGSGPHWYPKFIEEQKTVNTENILSTRHVGTMLTKDENLVTLEIEVQYQVNDIHNFLFKVDDPEKSLNQGAESALRQVVGMNTLDFIITSGRGEVEEQTMRQLVGLLDGYKAGIRIEAINLKDAKAPNQVKAAFDDATKAREDRERFLHEAEAYYNKVVPEAKGTAKQMIEEAEGYKQAAINSALGDADRFKQILPEYDKAPRVTKSRLYLDAMEQVLSNSSKVMVDLGANGNNMVYLPLDKLLSNRSANTDDKNIPKVAPLQTEDQPDSSQHAAQQDGDTAGIRVRDRDNRSA